MTKINQIQNALRELDGGSFQKLADAYLHKKGYKRINPLGSVIGADKTKKGTPDTFISLPNGKYVFAEYTTQRSGICEKFKDDLGKCFDETKTGVPVKMIEEVVLCHTSTFTTKEERALAKECQKRGVNLNIFGIGSISNDLCYDYPGLAQEHLGIEIDTGQIVSPDEFVATYNKSKVVARLDTAFHFRDEKIEEVLQELETGDLVIVSGRPGIGKSRLALECCKRFKYAHPEYGVRCILNRELNLFEDLRIYFSEPGHFLILVDDANRISRFEYIVQLLQDQREDKRIKVIVTVRDYALDQVREAACPLGIESIVELQVMEDTQIKQLVMDEYGILNERYLDRIAKVARGNPRLAIMAAEVTSRENTLESINDVTALYDGYFASIRIDIEDFGDTNVLKAAGIVALFQSVDRTNGEMMGDIEEAFGIPTETFWKAARRLHDLEVLDIYENGVVRTSDQVLSTYLFYLAFFKDCALDFSAILNHFYPRLRHRLVDAIYPVMSAFDSDAITEAMRPHVDRIWGSMEERGDHQSLLHLMDDFWFIKQTDTLVYVQNRIQEMEAKPTDLSKLEFKASFGISSPSILSVLGSFRQADNATFRIAFGLLFDYLDKRPEEAPKVLLLLIDQFGFRDTSHHFGYTIQREVIDVLWERTLEENDELYSKLFLAVAEQYLQILFNTTESNGHHAFNMINFQLAPIPELFELRRAIWNRLFQLYKTSTLRDKVIGLLQSYSTSGCLVSASDIVAKDAAEVLPFIESEFDPASYHHCSLVHKYLDGLDHCEVVFDRNLRNKFTNEAYKLSKILLFDRSDMRSLGLSRNEYEQLKKKTIVRYFEGFCFADYKQFFEQCQKIQAELDNYHKVFLLKSGVIDVLLTLADQNSDLYIEVLEHYIEMGDPLSLNSVSLTKKLVEICGNERACEVLSKPKYQTKRVWLFGYYISLPPNAITHENLDQICALYREAQIAELPHSFDFLLGYRSIDEEVIAQVTEITLEKTEEDSGSIDPLSMMFNPYTDVNKVIIDLFANDLDLLKRAYFVVLKAEPDMDYDGQTFTRILDLEPNFVLDYVNQMYKGKEWPDRYDDILDYTFIWTRDDYEDLMTRVTENIYGREVGRELLQNTYLETFFVLKENVKDHPEVKEHQDCFLKSLVERQHNDPDFMEFIFSMITHFSPERRLQFVALLLEHNKNFELFRKIPLEPNSCGWIGSAVPMLQKRAEYFESLLPLLNTVDLLQHKQHVKRKIGKIRSNIEWEQKRDFMED